MRIIATALAKNEADVVQEGVREVLRFVDAFIIYDNGSVDGTPDLAEQAGALVIRGPQGEPFSEGLRQHMLDALPDFKPNVVMRVDVDEMYHIAPPDFDPRKTVEIAFRDEGAFCMRACQAEFWPTLDDVRRGWILEDERVSIQKRRRWYTIGHDAMVAWKYRPDLRYYSDVKIQGRKNVPLDEQGRDVSQLGPASRLVLLQKHYNCRNWCQTWQRTRDRQSNLWIFGKYRYPLVVDESYGLYHLGPDDKFNFTPNYQVISKWYEDSMELYKQRGL